MGAAAQLDRIDVAAGALVRPGLAAHRHDPDLVAVFLAKQRLRAHRAGVVGRHDAGFHRRVLADDPVHLGLDLREFLGRQRLAVAEIEPQPVLGIQRSLLRDMRPQRRPQRLVQKVGGRVVGLDRPAPRGIDRQDRALPASDPALRDLGHVDEEVPGLAGVGHAGRAGIGLDEAAIAHLPAAFGVERRLVHDDPDLLALGRRLDLGPVDHQRQDRALGLVGVIAQELGRAVAVGKVEPDRGVPRLARARPSGARLGLLLGHRAVEARDLDPAPLLAQRVLRQVQREAVGVVKLERRLAGQVRALGQARDLVAQKPQPAIERLAETRLLAPQRLLDHRLSAGEFGVGRAHLPDQRGHQLVHHRVLGPQHVRVAHRAAHDPAQDVAAPLVRRHHPVGDQEAGRTQVVGDHAVVDLAGAVGVAVGRMRRRLDQRAHQVGVVVVVLALQERADPFQPHAGVDRRVRQRLHRAVLELLELHEDEVPDLDEAIAVLVRAAGRAAPDAVAVVVEDFGAGAARAGRAHPPEVVVGRDADDPVVAKPCDLLPDRRRLVIGVVDGDQQLVFGDAKVLGQQLPRVGDRLFLEVVAEAEVAQHLEERVVPRRIAHVVEVVVLAARAHAFLRARRTDVVALFDPGEQVLELHHAGVREHQRGIVPRHQGRAVHPGVPVPFVEVEEGRADVVQTGHREAFRLGERQSQHISTCPAGVKAQARRGVCRVGW